MSGSKGGGGGGKGGSFNPPAQQYGGGNRYQTGYSQPQLSQMPYNPMRDVYGSSQNVMQPMPGYYNQYPAGGSNYQPYQPMPQPQPQPQPDPAPAPNPGTGPIHGQGGRYGNPTQPNMDFNNYNMNHIGNLVNRSAFGNYQGMPSSSMQTQYTPDVEKISFNQFLAPESSDASMNFENTMSPLSQMPILDAADNPGFGGYDQNARATMYAPHFGGFR